MVGDRDAHLLRGLFVSLACVQFWTVDSAELALAFTYGGNTLTQYPLTIYPSEVVKVLTFVVPIAFVNWYPSLFVLDRPDPFGLPVRASVRLTAWRPPSFWGRRPWSGAPECATTARQDLTWL